MDKSTALLPLEKSLNIYKKSKVKPQGFNLFCSMFNWRYERNLHSRFIGMMLSMKREFFVSFLEELHRADDRFFKDEDLVYFKGCACEIHPNKDEHWEWKRKLST